MALNLRTVRSGTGPYYFFIHGLFGSSNDWSGVISSLPHTRGVLAMDLPGHGGSDAVDPHISTFDQCIDLLLSELRSVIQEPVIGIGYSLGGRILLGLWNQAPELFSALCLVSTFPGFEDEEERRQRVCSDQKWIEKLEGLSGDEFFSEWYHQPLFARSEWSAVVENRILKSRVGLRTADLSGFFAATSAASMPSFWADLSGAVLPVHYIVGCRDAKYVQIAGQLAAGNPAISVSVIEGAGHLVPLEKPVELALSLDEFAGRSAYR